MDANLNNGNSNGARQNRVKLLKKIIVQTGITFIIIPNICAIFLFMQVSKLQEDIADIHQILFQLDEKMEQLQGSLTQEVLAVDTVEIVENNTLFDIVETELLSEENVSLKKVYLTFDDGPSANTFKILDILKEYDIKATFFVNGKESEYAQRAYKQIVEDGHTLGLHSYSHDYNVIYASLDAYVEDLIRLQDYLYELTGVRSKYVRFPGGSSNTISKVSMLELIEYLDDNGFVYYDWNISSGDSSATNLSVDKIVANCTDNIKLFNTSIVLLHDATNKANVVEALPKIIEKINSMDNVPMLAIDDDTTVVHHIVN